VHRVRDAIPLATIITSALGLYNVPGAMCQKRQVWAFAWLDMVAVPSVVWTQTAAYSLGVMFALVELAKQIQRDVEQNA